MHCVRAIPLLVIDMCPLPPRTTDRNRRRRRRYFARNRSTSNATVV